MTIFETIHCSLLFYVLSAPVRSVYFSVSNSPTASHQGQSHPSSGSTGYSGGHRHHLSVQQQQQQQQLATLPPNDRHPSRSDQSQPGSSNSPTNAPVVEMTFLAGVPGPLRCVAVGGYPPPEISVRVGITGSSVGDEDDVTDRMSTLSHSTSLVGEPGLRVMLYRTERSTDSLVLGAEDDGKTITCSAAVADIGSLSATAKLVVHRK